MTLTLVMLNPLFFFVTFADIKTPINRWAAGFGAVLMPLFYSLDGASSLLLTALVGGTLAYALQRKLDQRKTGSGART